MRPIKVPFERIFLFMILISLPILAYSLPHDTQGKSLSSTSVCSKAELQKIQQENTNKRVIKTFYKLQNDHADISAFRPLFAKKYDISDLAYLDVPKKAADNIENRIKAFRIAYPGYSVKTHKLMANGDQVFIWFEVFTSKKISLLNSFVLFTLKDAKITHAVEVVAMNESTKAGH